MKKNKVTDIEETVRWIIRETEERRDREKENQRETQSEADKIRESKIQTETERGRDSAQQRKS